MAWEFMLKPEDIVPVKTPFSNPSTVNVSVSTIIAHGINNNLGNAFMLIFDNPNGCMIRYFNINGDTAYLATANYINDNDRIGIGEISNIQTINNGGVYCTNPWATPVTLGFGPVAFNFSTKTVNNINYFTQGGYSMGAYHAIYVPPTVTNIYIDGNPLVTYTWSSVPSISGKNGILLPMSTLNDINDGNEVTTSDTSKFNLNDSSNIKSLVDAVVNDF